MTPETTRKAVVSCGKLGKAHMRRQYMYCHHMLDTSMYKRIKLIRGAFKKSVAFDIRVTVTQPKRIIFFYIISLFMNAHTPDVLQALNY